MSEPKSIQDPNMSLDCPDCKGKGYFYLRTHKGKETVVRPSILFDNPLADGAFRKINCDRCDGTGKWNLGEVKY